MSDQDQRQKSIELSVNTCVHHIGMYYKICEAGVEYESVIDRHDDRTDLPPGYRNAIPCSPKLGLGRDIVCRIDCPKRQFPTEAEATEKYDRREANFKKKMDMLANDVCPTHEIKITKTQVGRCVYAKECGCRLYQGKLNK